MPDRYKSILLFGAPGVGKGTQGKLLGQIPGIHHLATGDMFRSLDKQSELGRKFVEYSSRGELVPDDLTIALWQQYVGGLIKGKKFSPVSDLLVLDGVPRSVAQARALAPHVEVLRIVHLACNDVDEMVGRMKRRATRENRHDDADETVIRRRFDVYDRETSPVLDYYDHDKIAQVDCSGSPAEVLLHVLEVVVPVYNKHFGNPLSQASH